MLEKSLKIFRTKIFILYLEKVELLVFFYRYTPNEKIKHRNMFLYILVNVGNSTYKKPKKYNEVDRKREEVRREKNGEEEGEVASIKSG